MSFERDADGKPLWHAPRVNPAWDDDHSQPMWGPCQFCGETWPCATNRAQTEPVPITGVWLRGGADSALEVLVEIDKQWRLVIVESGSSDLISHIVEPLGIRHGTPVGNPSEPQP